MFKGWAALSQWINISSENPLSYHVDNGFSDGKRYSLLGISLDIHCFANGEKNGASFHEVSEEEIEEAFFYPSDLVNTKTTIPFRVGEEQWIYASTLRFSAYIHHYSPPLQGIVVYYSHNISRLLRV